VRVLVTGYSDIDVVIDAINRGAVYRYLSKPWDVDEAQATICKNIVEEHHGSIEVFSEPGRNGFRISLPAKSHPYQDS
jgi:ActR/RegA family two-component response regulator